MTICRHTACPYDAIHDTPDCLMHWDQTRRTAPIPALIPNDEPGPLTATYEAIADRLRAAHVPYSTSYQPAAPGWLARAIGRIIG